MLSPAQNAPPLLPGFGKKSIQLFSNASLPKLYKESEDYDLNIKLPHTIGDITFYNRTELIEWVEKQIEYNHNMIDKCTDITDYDQWKQWLDKWNVKYEEKGWNPNVKELIVDSKYSVTAIVFDLHDKFLHILAYE